jgi:RNA polymerase sigma factor (TIGR02999 family)
MTAGVAGFRLRPRVDVREAIADPEGNEYPALLTLQPAPLDETLTTWLHRLREGDSEALDRVLPVVYDELRALARAHLRRENAGHTLETTALVHEAYLRLSRREALKPEDRRHFFAIAAQAMRHVLIDHARGRNRLKRGAGARPISLEHAGLVITDETATDFLALDDALDRLATANARAARVVELRFFAGLTLEETAEVLEVSLKTVQRDWIIAKAWLRKEIVGQLSSLDVS